MKAGRDAYRLLRQQTQQPGRQYPVRAECASHAAESLRAADEADDQYEETDEEKFKHNGEDKFKYIGLSHEAAEEEYEPSRRDGAGGWHRRAPIAA